MVMECNYGGGLFLEFQPFTDCMLCEYVEGVVQRKKPQSTFCASVRPWLHSNMHI